MAQTFQPTAPGVVTTIRHGLDATGGLTSFNLYIAEATTSGEPPLNYRSVNLYAGLGLTNFSSGSQTINGIVNLSSSEQFRIQPEWCGKTYALIFEKAGGGSLVNRLTSGGGAYTRGDGYVLGSTWNQASGCSSTRHDLAFEILGEAGFELSAPSPGIAGGFNSWDVNCAKPFETVYFAYSLNTSPPTSVPGCTGLFLDLKNATAFGNAVANVSGFASITKFVPAAAAGKTVHFQAVQRNPVCWTSELVSHTF